MQSNKIAVRFRTDRTLKYVYIATLFLLALSGFAQMPIFKRYYIADIPGLGWLDQFYTTHFLHYLGAAVILGLAAHALAGFFLTGRKRFAISASGLARGALLAGIFISGIFLVVKNSLFAPFSPSVIIFMDLFHLGLVMLFFLYALFCLIAKKGWIRDNKSYKDQKSPG
jgi:hypothetical protein